jgi:hypothetical protein
MEAFASYLLLQYQYSITTTPTAVITSRVRVIELGIQSFGSPIQIRTTLHGLRAEAWD